MPPILCIVQHTCGTIARFVCFVNSWIFNLSKFSRFVCVFLFVASCWNRVARETRNDRQLVRIKSVYFYSFERNSTIVKCRQTSKALWEWNEEKNEWKQPTTATKNYNAHWLGKSRETIRCVCDVFRVITLLFLSIWFFRRFGSFSRWSQQEKIFSFSLLLFQSHNPTSAWKWEQKN